MKQAPNSADPAERNCNGGEERIKELSEAITRNINGVHKDTSNVKKWATEILYHCEIMEKC